jgi:hypothetical protein
MDFMLDNFERKIMKKFPKDHELFNRTAKSDLSWCSKSDPPPPRLARWGTATVRQKAAATAASTALPP